MILRGLAFLHIFDSLSQISHVAFYVCNSVIKIAQFFNLFGKFLKLISIKLIVIVLELLKFLFKIVDVVAEPFQVTRILSGAF